MKYMSIEECHRSNGDRHAQKAKYWIAAGKPDYAEGSMRKARRNWQRADVWKISVPEDIRLAHDILRKAITQNLYDYGTSAGSLEGLF